MDRANPHFSIAFVNEIQESINDPFFLLLLAPPLTEPEPDAQKKRKLSKVKTTAEDEHLNSSTEERIP